MKENKSLHRNQNVKANFYTTARPNEKRQIITTQRERQREKEREREKERAEARYPQNAGFIITHFGSKV